MTSRSTSFLPRIGGLLLCLAAAACGGGPDAAKLTDEGYASLGKSDWKNARADFDAALAQLKTTDAGYLRAKLGSIEALVQLEPAKAKDEFVALAAGMASQVKASDFISVASKLTGKQAFTEAVAVLEAGLKAFPEDPKVRAVGDAIVKAAQNAPDPEAKKALESLSGLGYTGG